MPIDTLPRDSSDAVIARPCGALGLLLIALLALWPSRAQAEPGAPDLTVVTIIPSATEPPKVLVVVRNVGTETLHHSFEVALWLDGALLGRQRIATNLYPNAKETLDVIFARPLILPKGFHTFKAVVDVGDHVKELDETNNSRELTVWAKRPGDAPGATSQGRRGR